MKGFETRTLVAIVLIMISFVNLTTVGLLLKLYETLGVSIFVFLLFTSSTLLPLVVGFLIIPPYVLVAKITPSHVEATVFAFTSSILGIACFAIAKMMGVFWNSYVFHVTEDSLEDLYKAYIFAACCALFSLVYIPILPTWAEVKEKQEQLIEINLQA